MTQLEVRENLAMQSSKSVLLAAKSTKRIFMRVDELNVSVFEIKDV